MRMMVEMALDAMVTIKMMVDIMLMTTCDVDDIDDGGDGVDCNNKNDDNDDDKYNNGNDNDE